MPYPPKQVDPVDLCEPEFLQALHVFENLDDDVVAVVYSDPVVERRLSSRPGKLDVLP